MCWKIRTVWRADENAKVTSSHTDEGDDLGGLSQENQKHQLKTQTIWVDDSSSLIDFRLWEQKVVLMHSNGGDRKVFDDLSEAIQYLAPILNNKKFDETILNAHTAGNRTRVIVYRGSVYSG